MTTSTEQHSPIAAAPAGAAVPATTRGRKGQGTQRERRPGVWEIRIPIACDPATGRRRQVSVTVRGTAVEATSRRAQLVAWHHDHPQILTGPTVGPLPPSSRVTVGQLLEVWLVADHPWKPSTLVGYRSTARALSTDPIAGSRAQSLTPQQVRERLSVWEAAGAGLAVRGGRFRVLRACLSWAYNERLIDTHPIRLMRGPGRTTHRRPMGHNELHALLLTAELRLLEAHANHHQPNSVSALMRVHRAEQDLLLVRLAADTGARRGELAALQFDDLTAPPAPAAAGPARTLRIERAISAGQVTTPKSGHGRVLTIGIDTAALWQRTHRSWVNRHHETHDGSRSTSGSFGPWVFTSDLAHHRRLGSEVLGHRFERLRDAAGVPDATLHRLRHTVATYLVANGQILQAQARLGHADAATTLREYSYALPALDIDVADSINDHLDISHSTMRSATSDATEP